jgi:general secretion pathway protein A
VANTNVYEQYFGLREHPFSITPDPRFVYLSDIHRTALLHLESGATGGVNGFVLLTGDVGAGKTTICRTFLEHLPPQTEVALVLNPVLTLNEFLQTICDELDLAVEGSRESNKNLIDQLNRFLLQVYAVGQKTILIVDEAQNLSQELLEQIRLLTNLETATDKLLQIFLIGQPTLREMLNRPEMEQVSQRITSRYHLGPLGREDVRHYIERRLEIAGASDIEFTRSGLRRIYAFSKGVPRVINVLCDKTLMTAYENGTHKIDAGIVREAERRVVGNQPAPRPESSGWFGTIAASGLALAGLLLLAGALWQDVGGLRGWVDRQLGGPGDVAVTADEQPTSVVGDENAGAETVASIEPSDPPPVDIDGAVSSADGTPLLASAVDTGSTGPQPGRDDQEADLSRPLDPQSVDSEPTDAELARAVAPVAESPPAGMQVAGAVETDAVVAPAVSPADVPSSAANAVGETALPPPAVSPPPRTTGAASPETAPATRTRPGDVVAEPQQSLVDYTRRYAERKLLAMWGITDTNNMGLDFCKAAERRGLECLNEQSRLRGLYLYDRPAVVFLNIDSVSTYAVVLKASAASVVLDVLGQEHVVPAASLGDVWDGTFRLLWKQPQGVSSYLREGMSGPSVLWLRRALDRIEGRATIGDIYDADLLARVKRFQRDVGLTTDGIVGPRTFILLQNRLAEPPA